MHAANPFPTHRWASALLARAFRVGGATGRGVQPSYIESCCFRRAHGVDDNSSRRARACDGLESFNMDVAPFSRNQGVLLGSQPEPVMSIQLQTNCSSCAAREENHRRTEPAFLFGLSAIAIEVQKHLIDDIERKQAANYLLQPLFGLR
jgi:hypothetical protein